MKTKIYILALVMITFSINIACNNNPKVITASSQDESSIKSSGVFTNSNEANSNTEVNFNTPSIDEIHKVVVNEVLPTAKYVYLNVNEGDKKYWIATGKKEINIGKTYYFKDGLLKTNFESKEYNRVFETVYLVTNLVAENHSNNSAKTNIGNYSNLEQDNSNKIDIETHTNKVIQEKGSMKISELLKNPKKYEGKIVQLTGICTKVNAEIMGRNWIHIKDGSKDDFDLVITSKSFVPEGKTFTMKAEVTLNKDFGAGYAYDIILENGELIK